MTQTTHPHLFEVLPTGDPGWRGWRIREYAESFDEHVCTAREDLSPQPTRAAAERLLRRLCPGCRIRRGR